MSEAVIYRWRDDGLELLDYCDMTLTEVEAADSWLVTEGAALGLDLHRTRFMTSIPRGRYRQLDPVAFWDAVVAMIPDEGDWFPRVELHSRLGGARLVYRHRTAPERARSVVVATHRGKDPRRVPGVKGPDLERMQAVRTAVQPLGAQEGVILDDDGYVVEGAYSALLWWRGDLLCGPPATFPRVDSVTTRTVLTIAAALGVETLEEAVTPAELDGTELWALSALHGIRIVTAWVDGPAMAELPGRLQQWRDRLDALRRPIHRQDEHGAS
jgi:branched-subunit amino acid aminotransferase/4-amino-4-deoxychorismate lyase